MEKAINGLKIWAWYPFTLANLNNVPMTSGIYCLGINEAIIYIGSSKNLHERLTDHYYTTDICIKKATHFAIEPCSNYKEREQELLVWFQSKYGRLPICNDRI